MQTLWLNQTHLTFSYDVIIWTKQPVVFHQKWTLAQVITLTQQELLAFCDLLMLLRQVHWSHLPLLIRQFGVGAKETLGLIAELLSFFWFIHSNGHRHLNDNHDSLELADSFSFCAREMREYRNTHTRTQIGAVGEVETKSWLPDEWEGVNYWAASPITWLFWFILVLSPCRQLLSLTRTLKKDTLFSSSSSW